MADRGAALARDNPTLAVKLDSFVAEGRWTPSQSRVHVDFYVAKEPLVFLESGRVIDGSLQVRILEDLFAAKHHTRDVDDLTILYLH